MPCMRLIEALESLYPSLPPEDRRLADSLYSLLARLEPPLRPGKADELRVEALEALIRGGRLVEALEEARLLYVEWRRRRMRGGLVLAAGLVALVALGAAVNLLALLVGLPVYAGFAAWLCNARGPC